MSIFFFIQEYGAFKGTDALSNDTALPNSVSLLEEVFSIGEKFAPDIT